MVLNKDFISIGDVCDIRFGLYAKPESSGEVPYLQVRQFNDLGQFVYAPDEFLSLEKNKANLLADGDILLVSKGNRLFSWCYRDENGPAIASSIFFILRPDQTRLHPEYLSSILNTVNSKKAFQQLGGGSNIFSIRKSELADFKIPVLPLKKQKAVAKLTELHQQEIAIMQQLMQEKHKLYTALISKLIK